MKEKEVRKQELFKDLFVTARCYVQRQKGLLFFFIHPPVVSQLSVNKVKKENQLCDIIGGSE